MKIYELSNELTTDSNKVTSKDIITFLRENGYPKTSSHQQTIPEEMIDAIKDRFSSVVTVSNTAPVVEEKVEEIKKPEVSTKIFKPDDVITVRSITPWQVVVVGADNHTVYNWEGFGDIEYVTYKDLQFLRRKEIITKPMVMIEDADLCYQWRRELGDTYKYYLGVDYPEEFFDLSDSEFEKILNNAPNVVKEVIKFTALNMVRNQNYPTLQKLTLIDSILGTCLKDFI